MDENEQHTENLIETFKHLEYVLDQTKRPLKIALKCHNYRSEKVDIEKVDDSVQRLLKKEVDTVRSYQGRINILLQLIEMQVLDNQEKQNAVAQEIAKKEKAYDIDQKCHVLHDKSMELTKVDGIERQEPDASVPDTWRQECHDIINQSAASRDVSDQLVVDADTVISEVHQV